MTKLISTYIISVVQPQNIVVAVLCTLNVLRNDKVATSSISMITSKATSTCQKSVVDFMTKYITTS